MRLGVFILVLLLLNLESPCEAMEKPFQDLNVGADHHAINMTGFIITYTLIIVNSPDCEPSLIDDFPVRVQYRMISNGDGEQSNTSISEWMGSASPRAPETYMSNQCEANLTTSAADMPVITTLRSYSIMFPSDIDDVNSSQRVQVRVVQSDHRGGFCDCWAVSNLNISFTESNLEVNVMQACDSNGMNYTSLTDLLEDFAVVNNNKTLMCMEEMLMSNDTSILGFCRGSASIPRGFVSAELGAEIQSQCENTAAVVDTGRAPLMGDQQCDSLPYVRMSFEILFSSRNILESFDEGVEFGYQNLIHGTEWIPLAFYSFQRPNIRDDDIKLGPELMFSDTIAIIRGYSVDIYLVGGTIVHKAELKLCGSEIVGSDTSLKFRWLQTVVSSSAPNADPVYLGNITISVNSTQHSIVLLKDDFDRGGMVINTTRWTEVHHVSLDCPSGSDCRLQFGRTAPTFTPLMVDTVPLTIISRGISTVSLCPNYYFSTTASETTGATTALSTTVTVNTPSTNAYEVTSTPILVLPMSSAEDNILDYIRETQIFGNLYNLSQNTSSIAVLMILNDVILNNTAESEPESLTAAAYLLSATVSGLGSQTVEPATSETMLSTASGFLDIAQRQPRSEEKDLLELQYIAGSTLLRSMDEFALNNHNTSHSITSDNIVFHVEEVPALENISPLAPIQGEDAEIIIPIREVLADLQSGEEVRMAALLFRNMSGLLPDSMDYEDTSESEDFVFRLASPVISASFQQCDSCTISNLSTPVQVIFKHTSFDEVLLRMDPDSSMRCTFWKFNESDTGRSGAILFSGQWSEQGCETTFNSTITICKCHHLTHFAILLSAKRLKISNLQTLTLQIVGYIGVTTSLVAMAITIFVLLLLECRHRVYKNRPLVTMRNYVHIQLCATLGTAQIIFVAGIEPHYGQGHLVGGVPLGCRLVAVLLHYWFLVSFMWMLMEGVVLYVALVRIFVRYHTRYIAAFTVASYGLPLLYIGGLTVPLGFARNEAIRMHKYYDYGYEQACYLNPDSSFVWTFIAPVILILLANIGFFVMTIVIKYKNHKRRNKGNTKQVWHWLKASISLTVVMGITWIIGVLVIEVEELFALAFIFTIFVAFQGVFIFILFVLLSQQVKENYVKWWRSKIAKSDFLSKYFGESTPNVIVLPNPLAFESLNVVTSADAVNREH